VQGLRQYFQDHPNPSVELEETSGGLMDLMEVGINYSKVILVDAVVTGAVPGTLHRWNVKDRPLPASLSSCSTHGFDLAGAVELNRVLNRLPQSLVIYGIEARQFETGSGLSPEVISAATASQGLLLEELSLMNIYPPANR
jgi:hydrogenase maturation protease